jgi:hypothetical protein
MNKFFSNRDGVLLCYTEILLYQSSLLWNVPPQEYIVLGREWTIFPLILNFITLTNKLHGAESSLRS